ncbi:hypothetical protein HNQ51_000688 [Inhella inkyongensis]|uniref:Uncharacterized protein n=1 Tax=Inhella inkyongensis TaxID=392593 RepID=A0A840RZH4_9BURK|nr:hypothetical protein [Inhella inkyongensis]MBB5203395.1 hypothetical protein [Inhella inkyongensis]
MFALLLADRLGPALQHESIGFDGPIEGCMSSLRATPWFPVTNFTSLKWFKRVQGVLLAP